MMIFGDILHYFQKNFCTRMRAGFRKPALKRLIPPGISLMDIPACNESQEV